MNVQRALFSSPLATSLDMAGIVVTGITVANAAQLPGSVPVSVSQALHAS